MQNTTYLKFLFFPIIICILGLVLASVFQLKIPEESNLTPSNSLAIKIPTNFKPDTSFFDLEYQLRYSSVTDKSILKSKILNLQNKFEQEYLLALLEIRAEHYETAFEILMNLLSLSPNYYPYYDELADLANVTSNLGLVKNQIDKLSESKSNLMIYLNGIIAYKKGNYKDAIKLFETNITKDLESKETLFWLAYFYRGSGQYQKAMDILEKADKLVSEMDLFKPKIALAMGSLYYLSGDYENSEKYYSKGYNQAITNGNTVEEIRGLANLAIILDESGEVEKARINLSKAIDKAIGIENAYLIAFLHSELGVSYTYTNEIIDARENYRKSYKLYSRLKNRERLSYLSSNIGSIYLQLANYREALNYYSEGIEYAGENILGKILNLTGIADVYANMANYAKALEYYHKAGELADSIQDVSSQVRVNLGLGILFLNINRPNSALSYFYKSEQMVTPDEQPFTATDIYLRIGTVETLKDNYDQAEKYFKKALKLSDETGDIYSNLVIKTEYAYLKYLQNQLEEAAKFLNDTKNVSEQYNLKQLIGLQQLYIGKILLAKNMFDSAIEKLISAVQISSEVSDYNNQIEAGFSLAKLYLEFGDDKKAEEWFKRTIQLVENISVALFINQDVQIAHFSGLNEIYNSIIDFYIKNGRTNEAFEYLERSRSRNTLQNLVNLKLFNSKEEKEKVNRYLDLKWKAGSNLYNEDETQSILMELSELEEKFKANNIDYKKIVDRHHALSVEDLQRKLTGDEWLISIYCNNTSTEIFTLNKNEFTSGSLSIGKDSLRSLVAKISPVFNAGILSNEIYVNQDLFSYNAEWAGKLYKVLLENVLSKIPSDQKIIFSLPLELLTVPLELLVTNWNDSQSPYYYADKKFLLEKYSISYTPSASIYSRQKEFTSKDKTQILLVGDPAITNDNFIANYRSGLLEDDTFSFRGIKLFPLEYSKLEIESIDNLLDDDLVLLSDDATESNLQKNVSESKIIHLSTHSFLYKDQPLILLSQNDEEENDGFLEMGEIIRMDLNSDLVVLSSCRSGLGNIDDAEGIIGMQKSFFDAGTGSIIVSLWDVNDKYTSYFMESFYKHLSEGSNKSDALKKAKMQFIKKYSPNPYYWSAFILSGNTSAVKIKTKSSDLFYYILGVIILIATGFILKQRYDLYKREQSGKLY